MQLWPYFTNLSEIRLKLAQLKNTRLHSSGCLEAKSKKQRKPKTHTQKKPHKVEVLAMQIGILKPNQLGKIFSCTYRGSRSSPTFQHPKHLPGHQLQDQNIETQPFLKLILLFFPLHPHMNWIICNQEALSPHVSEGCSCLGQILPIPLTHGLGLSPQPCLSSPPSPVP